MISHLKSPTFHSLFSIVVRSICPMCVCSAGGTGVLLNVDRVAEMLGSLGHTGIQVRGLSDSGWFLDNKQYHCTDCVDTASCAPTETIKRGIKYGSQDISRCCAVDSDKIIRLLKFVIICPVRYWGGVVPERCRQTHEGEEWNCFFGYRVFPSIKSESGLSFCSVQDKQSVNASTYCKLKTSA